MRLSLIRRIYRSFMQCVKIVDGSTTNRRQTLLTPSKGYRVRFIRVKVLQASNDGRHLWEVFFGTAGNIITASNRSIEVLEVPDLGSAATRTFARNQGPRGKRDEVLSGRWRRVAPTSAHKIVIEYIEEA